MIDELNVDWESLTKADMYTIIKQTEEQNAKLRELVQYIYDECYGDDWFNEQAETLGFEQNF